jgi:hypothetical protein
MKHVDHICEIERIGCVIIRHGGKHDWYQNPNAGVSQPFLVIETLKNIWHEKSFAYFSRSRSRDRTNR